ncbi:MAG: amino acid-binding protein, partial [Deltaproteobacteria bacterium]|nr:amino acid-binding protein [Deltaproteobacteria bacterium]
MRKLVLSVLGKDRPGIVSKVAASLAALGCNIEDCSQTIL